ncbi:MAG: hypothetical protein PUF03_01280 [Lachnospiraceae bacterium]|nr:hypothetical protein [Lachnospiraceae bacterium]
MIKYGKIVLWLVIIMGIVTYYLKYLSFTKYNVCPIKECDNYLEKTYGKKFQRDCNFVEFQKNRGDYYLWKYKYFDETGSEFYECYLHPHENNETSPYLFFSSKRESGVVDYYWQLQLQKEFGEKFHLEQYQQVIESSTIQYKFEIKQESDIDKISNIIAETLCYTFQHVPELNEAVVAYAVFYREHCVFLLTLEPYNEVLKYIGKDKEQIYNFVYNEIYYKYQKEKRQAN